MMTQSYGWNLQRLQHSRNEISKMQSESVDFVPGAATWRTERNARVVFDSGHSLHYVKTWRHPQNRKYTTYRITIRGGPSHGHR